MVDQVFSREGVVAFIVRDPRSYVVAAAVGRGNDTRLLTIDCRRCGIVMVVVLFGGKVVGRDVSVIGHFDGQACSIGCLT